MDNDDELMDLLRKTPVQFWICPIREHAERRNTVTVEWRDNVAYCTFLGCDKTSVNVTPEEYDDER